jgi:hypothetical protein
MAFSQKLQPIHRPKSSVALGNRPEQNILIGWQLRQNAFGFFIQAIEGKRTRTNQNERSDPQSWGQETFFHERSYACLPRTSAS